MTDSWQFSFSPMSRAPTRTPWLPPPLPASVGSAPPSSSYKLILPPGYPCERRTGRAEDTTAQLAEGWAIPGAVERMCSVRLGPRLWTAIEFALLLRDRVQEEGTGPFRVPCSQSCP